MKKLAALGLGLSMLLGLAGCAKIRKINVYTTPQEMAIGEVFSSEVEAMMPILYDPKVEWYLNHRGRQLAALSDRADIPYSFNAIDTPELNAFAIPGGHIYFNLGMLEAAETENELLGVMAHEIGHVVAQHSMRQLSQQTIISIVGSIALNQYPNQWAALAANLFTTTTFLKMSRDDEREADRIGYDIMVRAGYNPEGMARLFEKLLKLREKEPNLLDKLFLTHPPSQERVDYVRARIAAEELPSDLRDDTPIYQEIRDHIITNYYTNSYRRRWEEFLRQKDKEKQEEEDRLPWDLSDEERKEREQREQEAQEGEQEGEQEEPRSDAAPPGNALGDGAAR